MQHGSWHLPVTSDAASPRSDRALISSSAYWGSRASSIWSLSSVCALPSPIIIRNRMLPSRSRETVTDASISPGISDGAGTGWLLAAACSWCWTLIVSSSGLRFGQSFRFRGVLA
jgi:hypothetical protein